MEGSVQQTADGGFIIAGSTESMDYVDQDVYLIKTDVDGNEQWSKTFGGTYRDSGSSVQQTADGGFIIAGTKDLLGSGVDGYDVYLIRTDADGNEQWSKTFGGPYWDSGSSVQQTADGGFIIAGGTKSFGAGESDVYLVKTDVDGNEQWSKTFGGSSADGRSVQQTTDGGFIIAGYTESFGAGESDVYLVKTDVNGNEQWSKTFGGSSTDYGFSVQQTTDGGFIIAGYTESFGAGESDVYLVKTDVNGNEQWSKTFGGPYRDSGSSVQQTADGGFIIAGRQVQDGSDRVYLIYYKPEAEVEKLLYSPVTPCRIVDTRKAGGAILPDAIRSYNVWGAVVSQGGNSAGCPSPKGEPRAVHVNVTSVPLGNGWITAYPYGSAAPTASLVNYRSDAQNVANSGTIKICSNCVKDINIKSGGGKTHVIIDVLGYYYSKP